MKPLHAAVALVVTLIILPGIQGRRNLLSRKRLTPVEKKKKEPWHVRWFQSRKKASAATNEAKGARKLVSSLNPWRPGIKSNNNKQSTREKKVKKPDSVKRNRFKTNVTHADAKHDASASCSLLTQTRTIWKRRGDATNADMAYRMAILSSLAYWDFDKRPTNNMTSVRLISNGKRSQESNEKSLRLTANVALCHVAKGINNRNTIVEQHHNKVHAKQQPSCRQVVSRNAKSGVEFDVQWYLHDWHEPTPLAGKWHDTDLLVTTSGDDMLVLSFAGTASAADAVTNVQTFERANHSGLFRDKGSIHRGFLNAYSRVERGKVSRICRKESCNHHYNNLTSSLHHRFQHCYNDDDDMSSNSTLSKAKRRKQCKGRDEKLMIILRELVTTALMAGHRVHLTGHSLGGGLATLCALDIILNFPLIPISKLHLWTFGSPQVADEVFLQSAMESSPRLERFISNRRKRRRYHRYVTLSDKCKADVVSTIASNAIASHKRGLYGRIARRLGGVRGRVIHMAEPHYLAPLAMAKNDGTAAANEEKMVPTKTGSTLGAHHITSYLQGISRESSNHPLKSNLPTHVANFVGEVEAGRS